MFNSVTRQRAANSNLLEYANKNRDEGFFSDITIVAGNERIPANRLVLSCYSTYLEGMFKFFERNPPFENIIEIEDVDGKALRSLINFVYTGSITISEQNVKDLLSGAHYLKLDEVKQFCFEFLRTRIAADTAMNILKVAIRYGNEDLQNEIHQYISINLNKVLQTDDFKALSSDELMSSISKLDCSPTNKSSIFQAIVAWAKHDQEARKTDFLELFKMISLDEVPINYLEEIILEEELVTTVVECHKLALSTFRKLLKEQNAKPNASKLLCVGGELGNRITSKAEVVFDLENRSSTENYSDLPEKIRCHCSVMMNGYIYCIGGDMKNYVLFWKGTDSVWRLNSKIQTSWWEQVASMQTKRCAMGAAVYGDVIVVAGGVDEDSKVLASTEIYLPSSNTWNIISPLKQRRSGHALVSCDKCLYAIGGLVSKTCLSLVEKLGDLKEEWINIEPMQTPRSLVAVVNCDGVVYAIGGRSGTNKSTALKTVEKYDSSANTWKYVSDMNFQRSAHAACVLCNKIYVVGGLDADGKAVTNIESYDPVYDTWSIVGNTIEIWQHILVAV